MPDTSKPYFLQCDCCFKLYDKIISLNHHQAADCASDFYIHNGLFRIFSFYGSEYDDLVFESRGWNAPSDSGLICDSCIGDLLKKTLIVEINVSE